MHDDDDVKMQSGRTTSRASYASLYNNVRSECKNSYDFVRELISNSYDHNAKRIDIFPHYIMSESAQPLVSIFAICDDGTGMDFFPRTAEENRGLSTPPHSSIDAYTSLGHSTNTGVNSIGRFCYGSKQAFNKADAGFILITRTERMADGGVLLIDVDDIEHELLRTGGVDWSIVTPDDACQAMRTRLMRLQTNSELANTILKISEWVQSLTHGTIQIIVSRAAQFHQLKLCHLNVKHRIWKKPSKPSRIFKDDIEFSTLYTVIRFCTRHGNAMHDTHKQFPGGMERKINQVFTHPDRLTRVAELRLFNDDYLDGYRVPYGYPRPDEHRAFPDDPSAIRGNRITDCTGCWARIGPLFFTDDANRTFMSTWDQNSFYTLRTDFESLSRRGWTRSACESLGTLAAGFRVQANGVRVCDLPAFVIRGLPITPESQLTKDERKQLVAFLQAGEKGGAVCTIEGNFNVEPNRACLSQNEINGLKNNTLFMVGFANVLHTFMNTKNNHGAMMNHLLKCHVKSQRELDEEDVEQEAERRREKCNESSRLFFHPTSSTPEWLRPLCMTHFIPTGDLRFEHQLQHLASTVLPFALYAAATTTTPQSQMHERALQYWKYLRAAMHFSAGVDVLAVVKPHECGARDALVNGHEVVESVYNVEYKWSLDTTTFNHPLVNTDIIAVWSTDNLTANVTKIEDKQECDAIVEPDASVDGFGLALLRIRDGGGTTVSSRRNASRDHVVHIIALRDLLRVTFEPWCDVQIYDSVCGVGRKKRGRG